MLPVQIAIGPRWGGEGKVGGGAPGGLPAAVSGYGRWSGWFWPGCSSGCGRRCAVRSVTVMVCGPPAPLRPARPRVTVTMATDWTGRAGYQPGVSRAPAWYRRQPHLLPFQSLLLS